MYIRVYFYIHIYFILWNVDFHKSRRQYEEALNMDFEILTLLLLDIDVS